MNHLKVIFLCALLSLNFGAGCSSSSGSKADGGGSGGHSGTGGAGTGGSDGGGTGGSGAGGTGTGGSDGGSTDAGGTDGGSGGAMGTDGGDGPAQGPLEFTDFVNDLIKNKTAANNRPETIDDKMFKDSMNRAAFDSLFP